MIQTVGPVFELKLNITDSELVLVADTAAWDSSAVILRSTTVLAFRPAFRERPLSCNLNNAEVFSCILGKEAETALSILDPVTVNLEIWGRGQAAPPTKGLLDVGDDTAELERMAELQLQQLTLRLSYHDAIMFRHILDSVPRQAQLAFASSASKEPEQQRPSAASTKEEEELSCQPANIRGQARQLAAALGFRPVDCLQALQQSGGQLDEAALWLTRNAEQVRGNAHEEPNSLVSAAEQHGTGNRQPFFANSSVSFSTVQLKTSCVNLIIIDDCKDADCPLVELSLSSLNLRQKFDGSGDLQSLVSASYYNRDLSAWEPCVEPWHCSLEWSQTRIGHLGAGSRLNLAIKSADVINLNLTSSLLDLYRSVKSNWAEDYQQGEGDAAAWGTRHSSQLNSPRAAVLRRRAPFIPYALQNETGGELWFKTKLVSAEARHSPAFRSRESSGSYGDHVGTEQEEDEDQGSVWRQVQHGETAAFTFQSRSKLRHQLSSKQDTHQVLVRVEGWREAKPVTVDRVGTYFRDVSAVRTTHSLTEIPPARLLFNISLEGSARKLVRVHSALELENRLDVPLRLRLENTALRVADTKEVELGARGGRLALPLLYCWARILARPVVASSHQWAFSSQPIHWCHILDSSDNTLELHESLYNNTLSSSANEESSASPPPFRFCVAVRRLDFPVESVPVSSSSKAWVQPAHCITFLPPVRLVNLLPCQLQFNVLTDQPIVVAANTTNNNGCGTLSPGREHHLLVDISTQFLLEFSVDGYSQPGSLLMQPGTGPFEARLKLADSQHRPLHLSARVTTECGGSLVVTVYATFWLVNRTGLPLVFKQEGEKQEASGQFEEHELARMIVPLLFYFPDSESSSPSIVARVGAGLHPEGKVAWCKHFYAQAGYSTVRRLRVAPPYMDKRRPEWVYIVAIDSRQGRGRHRLTTIVTISPRLQLYNQSPHRIQFAQLCFVGANAISGENHPEGAEEGEMNYLTAHPRSSLAFHWPRVDMDQLICLRLLDVPHCLWSGGFNIEQVDSFQLSVRDRAGRFHFLRVEISLVSSTFCIVLSSADNFPPPFRIDNFSEVALTFYQAGVVDQSLR